MCAPSCATEIDLPLTRAVDLTPESQALLDSSVGSAGYVFDYEAVESTTFSKTTTTLQVNQTLGTRVSVVTFPLCAPAHLVRPGAQIVDLVSYLAIMSVWSRSKERVCWQQSMECTDTTTSAVRHVGVRALYRESFVEK